MNMKLHKQFWIWLLVFTPVFMAVSVLIEYFFPGEAGFILVDELKQSAMIGVFVSFCMYFNRYTLKGEPREWYKSKKAGRKQ